MVRMASRVEPVPGVLTSTLLLPARFRLLPQAQQARKGKQGEQESKQASTQERERKKKKHAADEKSAEVWGMKNHETHKNASKVGGEKKREGADICVAGGAPEGNRVVVDGEA